MHTYNQKIIIVLVIAIALLFLPGNMRLMALGPTSLIIVLMLDRRTAQRDLHALTGALASVDTIVGGRRFVGRESLLVETRMVSGDRRILRFDQICRTNKGQWFLLRGESIRGSGCSAVKEVEALTEPEARAWFAHKPEKYRELFGAPELA